MPPFDAQHLLRRRAAVPAAVLALALPFAACGGDDGKGSSTAASAPATSAQTTPQATSTVADQSAEEVLAAARAAAAEASSVHVVGLAEGIGIDLRLARGKGAVGSIEQSGTRFDLIYADGDVFLRGNDAFYEQLAGRAGVQLLSGKWLKAPGDDSRFASFTQLADQEQLLRQVLNPESGTVTKGEVTDFEGTQAVPLRSRDGTLYVAATGDPLPLAIVSGGARRGRVDFTDWNAPVELTAPTDAIDIEELQRSGS